VSYFDIETEWRDMTCQMGFTGNEMKIRIVSDSVVDKEFIFEKLMGVIEKEIRGDGEYYKVSVCDEWEKYLKSEVVEVVRSKISRNGLDKRGRNYEMKFSIKFDNQGWWPDED
jgi:hypothetical protein